MPRLLIAFSLCAATVAWGADALPARLTAADVVRIALENRAEIEAARARVAAREGALTQAGLRPNPVLSLQSENWRTWGSPGFRTLQDAELFVFGSQQIEVGGKRRRRVEAAEFERLVAERERDLVERGIGLETLQAYLAARAAQRRVAALESGRAALDEAVRYHETRLELGAVAELDLIKVRVERDRYLVPLAVALSAAEQAKIELLRAMGQPDAEPTFEIVGDDDAALEGEAESWTRRAIARRPEAALVEANVERARARLELERAQAKPDPTPYFGYKRTDGFNTLVGGVSIPLPINNRNQGAIAAAASAVIEAEALARAARAVIRSEVQLAASAYRRALEAATSIDEGARRGAENALRVTQSAYREQAVELLSLLDAQRVKNEIELIYADALTEVDRGRLRLEAAIGVETGAPLAAGEGVQP